MGKFGFTETAICAGEVKTQIWIVTFNERHVQLEAPSYCRPVILESHNQLYVACNSLLSRVSEMHTCVP